MKTTIIRDDVTGIEVPESTETKITVGEVSGTLDLSPESLAALVSLANGEGADKLTSLLYPADVIAEHAQAIARRASTGRRTRSTSGGTRDAKADEFGILPETYRAWASEQGLAVNPRGRVPEEIKGKYRSAHNLSAPTTPATTPASGKTSKTSKTASVETPDPE